MGIVLRSAGKITLHKRSENIFVQQWTSGREFSLEDKRVELQRLLGEKAQIISEPEPSDKELIEWARDGTGRHPYYEMQEQLVEINARIVAVQDIITQCEAL